MSVPAVGAKASSTTARTPSIVVVRLVAFAISSGLLFGIDLGSVGGALESMTEDLHMTMDQAQTVVAGAKGGAIAGCLLGGAWMAAHGRRHAVAMSAVPFIVGPVVFGQAGSFAAAIAGRLVMGLGMGVASVAAPCFLSEVAPPSTRGALVACYELAIALGFMLASCLNYAIENVCSEMCWRYQAGLVPVLSALPLVLSCALLPESPRWLLSVAGGDPKKLLKALRAMRRLHAQGAGERLAKITELQKSGGGADSWDELAETPWSASESDLVSLWDERHSAAGSPLLLTAEAAAARPEELRQSAPREGVLRSLGSTLADAAAVARGQEGVPAGARFGLTLAILAAILDQACASTSVLEYAQHLLRDCGVASQEAQDGFAMCIAMAKVIGVVVGLLVANKVGRRPLLGWGAVASAAGLVAVAAGAALQNVAILLAGLCAFVLFFVATWGIGYWIVVTEVTVAGGPRYSGACQAATTLTFFVAGWLTSLTFVTVISALGPWGLLLYALLAFLGAVYAGVLLPETLGLTLEECAEVVRGNRVPKREPSGVRKEDSQNLSMERCSV